MAKMDHPPNYVVSERFEKALDWAVDLHRDQGRKGSRTPYVGHLLGVAGYVFEDGGSEDEAIAALLHDAIEDRDRSGLTQELIAAFGKHVVAIVQGCSREGGDADWRTRKQRYIDHLADSETQPEILRVSLADKLHNVRSILRDHREHSHRVWKRFNADPAETLWYYRSLRDIYLDRFPGAMAEEFAAEVERLESIIA
jgi:(p)ppGpp synthase/HD superfamily hydrolase